MKNTDNHMREIFDRYTDPMEEFQRKRKHSNSLRTICIGAAAAIVLILTGLLLASLLASCEKKELCELETHPHVCHTTLDVTINPAWESEPIYSPYTRAAETSLGMKMRYILEFWTVDEEQGQVAELIKRVVTTGKALKEGNNTETINVDLPAEKMAVLCWAEPLPDGAAINPYFDTTALPQVKMVKLGYGYGKDAFTASEIWDYTGYQLSNPHDKAINLSEKLTLMRPFGHYTVISNDMEEYKKKYAELHDGAMAPEPAKAVVKYHLWIPSMFNVFSQKAIGSLANASYTYPVSVRTEGKEYTLAEDLIFIGTQDGKDSYYNFNINTFTAAEIPIRETATAELHIQRNRHTLAIGAFLTNRKTNSPGIDDDFDDVIIVPIPD